MSDLSKRRPQIDFCAGYRAHKRGDPREGCSKAWHEGWDAHAELAVERERAGELDRAWTATNMELTKALAKVAKLREALGRFVASADRADSDDLADTDATYVVVAHLRRASAVLEETSDD